jgi:hypothetical protein
VLSETHGTITVSVAEVRVDHHVRIADFTKWLEQPGRTPQGGERAASDSLNPRFTDIRRAVVLEKAEGERVEFVSKTRQKIETRWRKGPIRLFWLGGVM